MNVLLDTNILLDFIQHNSFTDFEDCLQSECAKEINAEYIITQNVKDFAESEIAAISPADFLEMLTQADEE